VCLRRCGLNCPTFFPLFWDFGDRIGKMGFIRLVGPCQSDKGRLHNSGGDAHGVGRSGQNMGKMWERIVAILLMATRFVDHIWPNMNHKSPKRIVEPLPGAD